MLSLIATLLLTGWIADDLDAGLARAQAEGKPVIVDLWAPWCHTCLSMKRTVLVDPRIRARADDFIWVALDTDRPQNAPALTRLKPGAWPTFYMLSPTGEIRSRHVGAATVAEFEAFLAARAVDATRAAAAGEHAQAAALFADAIDQAPDSVDAIGWRVERLRALRKAKQYTACVSTALNALPVMARNGSAAAADFTWYAHDCAQKSSLLLELRTRAALRAATAPLATVLAHSEKLSPDDRSDALRIQRELAEADGDETAALAAADAQFQIIAAVWLSGRDPRVQMMLGWPLVELCVYLEPHRPGRTAAAKAMLKPVVEALPAEYDPPYRLAWLTHQMGEHAEALKWATLALSRVYGPRTARVHGLLARIHQALGDAAAALASAQAAVAVLKAQPEGQRSEAAIAAAVKAVDAYAIRP